jgi:hypothetical protein
MATQIPHAVMSSPVRKLLMKSETIPEFPPSCNIDKMPGTAGAPKYNEYTPTRENKKITIDTIRNATLTMIT